MAENKTDYTKPRTDLIELLPEPLQSDVNLSLFDNIFNRYLTKQEVEKVAGYIGQGNPNALRSRQIHEQDVHRQAYQLQPIPYNKIGSVEHMASWKDIQNELERLGVDISSFNEWGTTQKFNWVPPVDINKIINYRDYYWVDLEDPGSTPQYITIRNTCATATARVNFWDSLIAQFGSAMAIDEILPTTTSPATFTITEFPASNELKVEGDLTDEILRNDFIDIITTTSNIGTYFVNSDPVYSGITNETSITVSTAIITGSPVPATKVALRRFDKLVLAANDTLESGDYTSLFEEGFVIFVRNTANVDLNDTFVEVVSSTYDEALKQTSVTIDYRVTDDTAGGEVSLEEQLSIFESDKKCQCNNFGGWDTLQWDDNPLDLLWGDEENSTGASTPDGISDHTNLIDRISHAANPVAGVGTNGDLWYATTANVLYQAYGSPVAWDVIWNNFSLVIENTIGIDLWDMALPCDTRPRTDTATQWVADNHWLHKNDVVNFASVTRASIPIIEYDWDLELNEWTIIKYNWSYRAEGDFDYAAIAFTPPRIEIEPLTWWEHGATVDETIILDDRYGDLTDYFIPGMQVSFVDDLLKTTYTVVSSSYKTVGDFPYRTFIEFDNVPPTFTVAAAVVTENLSIPSPNAISIIPLNTMFGDTWLGYDIHWRFDSSDDSLPVPHQSKNPFMEIDVNDIATGVYEPFTALLTPTDFVASNTVYVDADFVVDWGDGNFVNYTAGTASSVASGNITVQSENSPTHAKFTTNTYTDIDITVSDTLTSALNMCKGLTNLLTFNMSDSSNITDFTSAWYQCFALTSFPLIDTSQGLDFNGAWYQCFALTSFPLIDTSQGLDFTDAWFDNEVLASFPLLDMSSGTNFTRTWLECAQLLSFPAIDMPAGTNFFRTWQQCESLTSFPLIDVSAGLTFKQAWTSCTGITSFPQLDTALSLDFYQTWFDNASLTSFPALDVSSGTDFLQTWYSCDVLASIGAIDTSSGTSFFETFRNCVSLVCLTSLDTTSATNTTDLFTNTPLLTAPSAGEQTSLATAPPGLAYTNPGSCP